MKRTAVPIPPAASRLRPAAASAAKVIAPGRRPRRVRWLPAVRTVDLYVARLFLAAYLACGLSFTGIYVMVEALTKLDRFLRAETPLWIALPEYLAAMVPVVYMNYLGPLLTTSAAVATAVYLHRGNELVPLAACGVSAHRTFVPIFVLAAGFSGLDYWLQEQAIPQLRGPIRRAISLSHDGALRPKPFFDAVGNQLILIKEYSPAVQVGRVVEVRRRYPNGADRERIDASEVVWESAPDSAPGQDRGRWVLHNGSIQRWDEQGELVQNRGATDFDRLKEPFAQKDLGGGLLPIDLETSDQDIAYLSFAELKTQLWRQPEQRHLAVKLHHHIAFPLMHLFLPAIAIPLVLLLGTRSALLSVAASVLLCFAFYLTSSLAMSTAVHSDAFPPLLAAWLPVLLFGSLGVTLTAHLRT